MSEGDSSWFDPGGPGHPELSVVYPSSILVLSAMPIRVSCARTVT